MRNIAVACWMVLYSGVLLGQETAAEKILNNVDASGVFSCKPDDLNGKGCCGAPGRKLCSTLPSCTDPGGNSRRNDTYDGTVICQLPKPSCSPAFAVSQAARAQKTPTMDVPFYVTSDIHYWREAFRLPDQVRHVRLMNEFSGLGKTWPTWIGFPGGSFPNPWGVVMAGDMTTFGQAEELGAYRMLYEQGTMADSIQYPVFHGLGNHDVDNMRMFDFVGDSMGCGVHLDPVSHSYSWDWNRLHLIQLNEWVGYTSVAANVNHSGLPWLIQDLNNLVGDSGRPVVIFQHLGCDNFSMGTNNTSSTCQDPDANSKAQKWWTAADRQSFLNVIKPYNVIGLFTGHTHSAEAHRVYELNDSSGNPVMRLDNFVNGSGGAGGNGEFFVVRVTDSYLDVVPVKWYDLSWGPDDDQRRDQSTETTRIDASTELDPPLKFGQAGCRKRIGDRFITVPSGTYRLASGGGNLVSVTNTGTVPIPGPFALRMRIPSPNVSFVDSCVDEGPANRSYVLFSLPLGQSLAPGNTAVVDAGTPFTSTTMEIVVLTPIQGADSAGVSITVAPKTAVPPGAINFYGPPNTDFFAEAVGGGFVPWLSTSPVAGRFDGFGRATVNYAVDPAKLPDQSTGSLTVAIRVTTGLSDALGKPYSRAVPFSLQFKAPVTVSLTATPAVFAQPNDPHVTFKVVLTHPQVTDPVIGTVPLPSGDVTLSEITSGGKPFLAIAFLGNQSLQNGVNCNTYPNDTAVFGNDGVHNYCPAQDVNNNPWQFSLSPGLHTLVADYEGSGNGDAYYQPATSAPFVYRVGPPAASIRVLSGNNQSTFTGVAFDSPIVMQVLDASSKPIIGAPVAVDFSPFAASAGFGASTEWDGFTDANGMATSARPIANGIAGGFSGVVRVTDPGTAILAPLAMTNQAPSGPAPVVAVSVASRVSPPSSPAGLRQWVLNFRNSGGPAHGMQMTQLVFTLESGTTCTPVVQTALPSLLEALPTAGSATTFPVLINFGTCPVTNRYTVTIGYSANGGAYASQTAIAHQFQ